MLAKIKPRRHSKKEIIVNLLMLTALLFGFVVATAPQHNVYAACVDGADDVTGEPCLELDATDLITNIFKWANIVIPVLLPIIAIGIGFMFGADILAGVKKFFSGVKIG